MAKFGQTFNAKGELSVGEMRIYEVKKEEVNTVDFQEILNQFDGKTVTISIRHEIEVVGELPEVEEDEEEEDYDYEE